MQNIKISSTELRKKNNLQLPNNASDFSGNTFWYYTSFETADKILTGSSIYLSNISIMNDNDESKLHREDGNRTHCLCLCNSDTEKIPMWYLYAGISGNGVAIGFTPATLINLITSIETLKTKWGETLKKGKDFDLEFGWVFYRKSDVTSQVNYKRKWYSIEDPENFEEGNYFIKSYPWEYEKEFRIVIHNKTDKIYDQLILDIDFVYEKLKLRLAPEFSEEKFRKLLPQNKGFMKYMTRKVDYSKLGISMNLCKRNFDSFVEYIESSARNDSEIDISRVCKAVGEKCSNKK